MAWPDSEPDPAAAINASPFHGIPARCLKLEKPQRGDVKRDGETWVMTWRFTYRPGGWDHGEPAPSA